MELKESGDIRCYLEHYEGGAEIPTIKLGCGGTIISCLYFDKDKSGVGFSLCNPETQVCEIGESHEGLNGKLVEDSGIFFQILFTDKRSVQVLIDKLEEASTYFDGELPDCLSTTVKVDE